MKKAYTNGKIFTGSTILTSYAVLTEGGRILEIVANEAVPSDYDTIDLAGNMLAPALIDIQIYGGNGQLFGEFPSVEALEATYQYCLSGGAHYFLPTVATNSPDIVETAIEAVRNYWVQGKKGVIGLHLEGPFINPIKRGAHLERYITTPSVEAIAQLLKKGKGIIKMMTLAPEVCSPDIITLLQNNGVIVSAGHTNATYQQAMTAFETIPVATHLYNAMSALQHREPGVVGAIFDHPKVRVSLVADGYHVDYAAIRVAKKILKKRLFLITDAVTESLSGRYTHRLDGERYVIADGTLSGSALTMLKAVQNCVQHIGISVEESLRMASLYPAQILGLGKQLGRIKKGYQAEFIVLDDNLNLMNNE